MKNAMIPPLVLLMSVTALFPVFIRGETLYELPELDRPEIMRIESGRIYVTDGKSVRIFNLETGRFIVRIGSEGEGPGEYKSFPKLNIIENRLVVNAGDRILFYSLDGILRDQKQTPVHEALFLPLGKGFAGRKTVMENGSGRFTQLVGLYDAEMIFRKAVCSGDMPWMLSLKTGNDGKLILPMLRDYVLYDVRDNNLIMGDSQKGLHFDVYDEEGSLIRSIDLPRKKEPVPHELKLFYSGRALAEPGLRGRKNMIRLDFPASLPAFRHFTAGREGILVHTYHRQDSRNEFLIIRPEDNSVSRFLVPWSISAYGDQPLFAVDSGSYYSLHENEESESWELHRHRLEELKTAVTHIPRENRTLKNKEMNHETSDQ